MVVNYLNVYWALRSPVKTQSKLIIDPNAVLTLAITRQRIKSISWRRAQKLQGICGIQLHKLTRSDFRNAREAPALSGLE